MPTATNAELIAGLYIAYFNRAPEAAGLSHWLGDFSRGADVRTQAANFAGHPVFEATYGGMGDQQFVETIYQNVLGASGDADGIAYWVGELNNGVPRHQMVADFVHSSLTIDLGAARDAGELTQAEFEVAVQRQATLTHKSEIGVLYAAQLGAVTNLAAGTDPNSKQSLEADISYRSAQAIIAGVNADASSKQPAGTLILSAVEDLEANGGANVKLVVPAQAQGGVDATTYAGRPGAPDLYLVSTANFSAGDTVRFTNFDQDLDGMYFGDQYGYRSSMAGDGSMLEIFVQQQGSDVHFTVEKTPNGSDTGAVVNIIIVGATVEEMVPAGSFLP